MDIDASAPAVIDAEIARLQTIRLTTQTRRVAHLDTLHQLAGDQRRWHNGMWTPWTMTTDEVLARDPFIPAHRRVAWNNHLTGYRATGAKIAALDAELAPLNERYTSERWPRFFLVTNDNGHIHRDLHCKTCHVTTEFNWLTELSGMSEADAVAEHGAVLCTICYPTAPVEHTNGSTLGRAKAAEKAQRAAEKTARQSAKAAKSLTGDGTEYRFVEADGHVERFKTIVAARNYAINELRNHRYYRDERARRNAVAIVAVIAARTGDDPADLLAKYTKTAAKG